VINQADIMRELAAAIDGGKAVALATVVATRRSVPRRPGSKMLVYPDGSISGTIGGGEMEHRVKLEAAAALVDGKPRLLSYSLLDPSEGDPGVCGGEADIYVEPFMPDPRLFIIGAGHVGTAVAELAHWLGFRTVVWDDRSELAEQAARSDNVNTALAGPITNLVEEHAVEPNDAVVIVTRNVALDLDILPVILGTSAGYVGLMGSNRRWATTRSKLADIGFESAELDRVTAPIGVEIAAETPAEIAVSILAEVIAHRRGA
jgi:xanthine dehydrogenase accessory factor